MDTRRKPPDWRVSPILAGLILTAVLATTGAGEGETVVGGVVPGSVAKSVFHVVDGIILS